MAASEFCTYTESGKRCVGALEHTPGKHQMTAWNSAMAQAIARQTMPDRSVKKIEVVETLSVGVEAEHKTEEKK